MIVRRQQERNHLIENDSSSFLPEAHQLFQITTSEGELLDENLTLEGGLPNDLNHSRLQLAGTSIAMNGIVYLSSGISGIRCKNDLQTLGVNVPLRQVVK